MNREFSFDNFNRGQAAQDEEILYDYLLKNVQTSSPSQLIEDFRTLFLEGRDFRDAQVYSALEKIVKAKDSEQKFPFFFNRCCHILINRWQLQPQLHIAIPELVGLLEHIAPARSGYYSTSNHLRQLVKQFTLSDQYVKLQRLARVINTKQGDNNANSVGNLIHRYPYLYNYCLLGENNSREHQQTVRHIKSQTQQHFEVNLSRYITHKVRLAQMAQNPLLNEEAQRIIRPVKNPTLLSDQQLNKALKHFVGNVEGGSTYKNLSQNFLSHSVHTHTYKAFKDDLYEYLMGSIDPQYGRGQFNQKIYQLLQNCLPECDQQKPSEFLMLRTSSQLLNFLVVESSHQPEHYVFIDLITNMGETKTVGILLKVILLCNKVKPYLEKRFSILFNHYESFAREGVPWLVNSLENVQIAFSVHFGKVDLTSLKQLKLN